MTPCMLCAYEGAGHCDLLCRARLINRRAVVLHKHQKAEQVSRAVLKELDILSENIEALDARIAASAKGKE